jgi:erythromycin esterase-like protein/predicted phosphoribosyltransferase
MTRIFQDRKHAGILLSKKISSHLTAQEKSNAFILALARGGVPVAFEISHDLGIPLEVLIARKLGHPAHPEFALGAIAEDGNYILDKNSLQQSGISEEQMKPIIEKEQKEVQRRISYYRKNRLLPSLKNKTVIIVDDGLATGATAAAAIKFVRKQNAAKIILAVPVAATGTVERMRSSVDAIISTKLAANFRAVGDYYYNFDQTSDEDVLKLLHDETEILHPIEMRIELNAVPLMNKSSLTPLINKIAHAKVVMLGESTHGTQEFYEWRRLISQELIENHGYSFIAVEGDWPPCAALNRFIHSEAESSEAREKEMLKHFKRWPTWMWANTEIHKLTEWMHEHNLNNQPSYQAGFYGLDIYSLFESIDEVHNQLHKINPAVAREIRVRYNCFKRFLSETAYAKSLIKFPEGCENQVIKSLQKMLSLRLEGMQEDELLDAQQNAHIVRNAEKYYRSMVYSNDDSWNIRDRHMLDTLDRLLTHHGPNSKAIVWAHNTHIGDYRATDMQRLGQINIGGLAREKWGESNVSLIGFGTNEGEVLASHAWDGPIEVIDVPPGKPGSYESYFHNVSQRINSNAFYIWLEGALRDSELKNIHGHRAIGVVYDPVYEHRGNYVPTSLSKRYDGFIFVDKTKALTPLIQKFTHREIPDMWPAGL